MEYWRKRKEKSQRLCDCMKRKREANRAVQLSEQKDGQAIECSAFVPGEVGTAACQAPVDLPEKTHAIAEKPNNIPMEAHDVLKEAKGTECSAFVRSNVGTAVCQAPVDLPEKTHAIAEKPSDIPMEAHDVPKKATGTRIYSENVLRLLRYRDKVRERRRKTIEAIARAREAKMVKISNERTNAACCSAIECSSSADAVASSPENFSKNSKNVPEETRDISDKAEDTPKEPKDASKSRSSTSLQKARAILLEKKQRRRDKCLKAILAKREKNKNKNTGNDLNTSTKPVVYEIAAEGSAVPAEDLMGDIEEAWPKRCNVYNTLLNTDTVFRRNTIRADDVMDVEQAPSNHFNGSITTADLMPGVENVVLTRNLRNNSIASSSSAFAYTVEPAEIAGNLARHVSIGDYMKSNLGGDTTEGRLNRFIERLNNVLHEIIKHELTIDPDRLLLQSAAFFKRLLLLHMEENFFKMKEAIKMKKLIDFAKYRNYDELSRVLFHPSARDCYRAALEYAAGVYSESDIVDREVAVNDVNDRRLCSLSENEREEMTVGGATATLTTVEGRELDSLKEF